MALEVSGQLCLKKGMRGPGSGFQAFIRRILTNRWVQIGIASFLLEAVFWTWTLYLVPVDIAFPIGSVCFVGVALGAAWLLGESISLQRWIGIGLILLGVAMLGTGL